MEYTFRIYTGAKGKCFERTHYCKTLEAAENQLYGMLYAMFFTYKHPYGELWQGDKFIKSIR